MTVNFYPHQQRISNASAARRNVGLRDVDSRYESLNPKWAGEHKVLSAYPALARFVFVLRDALSSAFRSRMPVPLKISNLVNCFHATVGASIQVQDSCWKLYCTAVGTTEVRSLGCIVAELWAGSSVMHLTASTGGFRVDPLPCSFDLKGFLRVRRLPTSVVRR